MGPGDKFEEDPKGKVLYIKTPEGPIEVARQPTPGEEIIELKFAGAIGIPAGIVAFGYYLSYFLTKLDSIVINSYTGMPIPWADLNPMVKFFTSIYILVYPTVIGLSVWIMTVVIAVIIQTAKRIKHKQAWKALKRPRQ